jgi:hypothetical protein
VRDGLGSECQAFPRAPLGTDAFTIAKQPQPRWDKGRGERGKPHEIWALLDHTI